MTPKQWSSLLRHSQSVEHGMRFRGRDFALSHFPISQKVFYLAVYGVLTVAVLAAIYAPHGLLTVSSSSARSHRVSKFQVSYLCHSWFIFWPLHHLMLFVIERLCSCVQLWLSALVSIQSFLCEDPSSIQFCWALWKSLVSENSKGASELGWLNSVAP